MRFRPRFTGRYAAQRPMPLFGRLRTGMTFSFDLRISGLGYSLVIITVEGRTSPSRHTDRAGRQRTPAGVKPAGVRSPGAHLLPRTTGAASAAKPACRTGVPVGPCSRYASGSLDLGAQVLPEAANPVRGRRSDWPLPQIDATILPRANCWTPLSRSGYGRGRQAWRRIDC